MKAFGILLTVLVLVIASGCTTMKQYNALSPQEKAEYIAFSERMTIEERKVYLSKENLEGRHQYLQELGLYDDFVQTTAFTRLDEEKRRDFLKTYLNATPEEIEKMMAKYDEDMRDRIEKEDLQHGWSDREVLLSLGKPEDILQNKNNGNGDTNQLWIYNDNPKVTFLYFENGHLTNWAK